jgi:hypothetical protein
MTDRELMLECLKMGLVLTSPTVSDRRKELVICAKELYKECIAVETPNTDTPRRGRPPKPQVE